jgi:hypothetical protein
LPDCLLSTPRSPDSPIEDTLEAHMFDSVATTIDRILDLLGKGSQAKKSRLEIQKLEHELREAKSVIKKPDAKEIQQYDPKLQELLERIADDLHCYCHRMVRASASEAEDVTREVWQKAHADLKRASRDLRRDQTRGNVLRRRRSKQRPATALPKSQVRRTTRKRYPRRKV